MLHALFFEAFSFSEHRSWWSRSSAKPCTEPNLSQRSFNGLHLLRGWKTNRDLQKDFRNHRSIPKLDLKDIIEEARKVSRAPWRVSTNTSLGVLRF